MKTTITSTPKPKELYSWIRSFWMAGWLLLAAILFFYAAPEAENSHATSVQTAGLNVVDRPTSAPRSRTKPIGEIRCAERIQAKNPLLTDAERTWEEPAPATWRLLKLRLTENDSDSIEVELLRPLVWIDSHGADSGAVIWLDLAELGAEGFAEVLAIEGCPPIAPGTGPVVTAVFRHMAENIVDLHVEGLDEPIGVTDNHPVWSEDRQEFIPVSEFRPGEHLQDEKGRSAKVTAIIPRGPPQAVYNLEVQGEHVYRVSNSGFLVHNAKLDSAIEILHNDIRQSGKPVNRSTIRRLQEYYDRKNMKVHVLERPDRLRPKEWAKTRVFEDGSVHIYYRSGVTKYALWHEMFHAKDFIRMGRDFKMWQATTMPARELSVLYQLRHTVWDRLTPMEKWHAELYVEGKFREAGLPLDVGKGLFDPFEGLRLPSFWQ